jgi:hypothetical protein
MAETHFVQRGDGPIFAGAGAEVLACQCGRVLVAGYEPARFRGVGLQCGSCDTVTTTPPLPSGEKPPFALVIAEPTAEPRADTVTLPDHVFIIGRAEMDRLTALYRPVTPSDSLYRIDAALLERAASAYARHAGETLPAVAFDETDPFKGSRVHALGWAVSRLEKRLQAANWSTTEAAATSAAAVHLTGFLHFEATWAHHPLFPAMVETARSGGFPLHGLAVFAAAHCLVMMGNRISFPEPQGFPGRVETFHMVTGPTDGVSVQLSRFERFEYPYGRAWDEPALAGAVSERIGAEQGRINLKRPGVLVLSPGTALGGFDEALIRAVQGVLPNLGRKNRGLMAVAIMVLRMQAQPDPHTLRFGYGFFPVPNRHYQGDNVLESRPKEQG